jgi:hypothetical protein
MRCSRAGNVAAEIEELRVTRTVIARLLNAIR